MSTKWMKTPKYSV